MAALARQHPETVKRVFLEHDVDKVTCAAVVVVVVVVFLVL
jgi:hypothetical protein